MSKGVVLFAHNNEKTDYYKMAVYTARRVNRFLELPVTIITDSNTLSTSNTSDYTFDNTRVIDADKSNRRGKMAWINKGRYAVYHLTPYDDTLVLDADYMINSTKLLDTFNQPSDFVCYQNSRYLLEDIPNEIMSVQSLSIYWATVMRFTKNSRTHEIFKMIEMVQDNYEHYADLHKFMPYQYRNDYALTIALRTVNSHLDNRQDSIPGKLNHVGYKSWVERISDTSYKISSDIVMDQRRRTQYIQLNDYDFHMINKNNFMELMND